jgi:hypothetical protein
MKSTKIVDLIKNESNQENEKEETEIDQVDINEELRVQLGNLQHELNDIKKLPSKGEDFEKNSNVESIKSISKDDSWLESLLSVSFEDLKDIGILITVFTLINSVKFNDILDNMVPFSLYGYTYVIKALMLAIVFKFLQKMIYTNIN